MYKSQFNIIAALFFFLSLDFTHGGKIMKKLEKVKIKVQVSVTSLSVL